MSEMSQQLNSANGPVTIETLMQLNAELQKTIAAQNDLIADLRIQIANLQKMIFGSKSERSEVVLDTGDQIKMFDEAEQESTIPKEHPEMMEVSGYQRKAKRTNAEAFKNLPHEEVIHDVDDRSCPKCGSEMETIGKEFSHSEIIYKPAEFIVRDHYAAVVKCPNCGADESKDADLQDIEKIVIKKGKCPPPVIPGSYCSPNLLAWIIYQKFQMGIPLYRQEQDFKANKVPIPRQTLANWVIFAAMVYGKPIFEAMKAELLQDPCIHADETSVQVLRENDRKATTQSKMWCFCSTKQSGKHNVLFNYTRTRAGYNAAEFLGNYSGYCVCDGFDGYNQTKVKRCGCWVHARRKFIECLPNVKPVPEDSIAAQGIKRIDRIIGLSEAIEEKPFEERVKTRQELLKPELDDFFVWLDGIPFCGSSHLSKAINYARNEERYLRRFLESPYAPAHNNRAENAIRPFTVGRKNWLFCNSPKGAEASAILYSIVHTAYANDLNVQEYLTRVFTERTVILPWKTDSQTERND